MRHSCLDDTPQKVMCKWKQKKNELQKYGLHSVTNNTTRRLGNDNLRLQICNSSYVCVFNTGGVLELYFTRSLP